MADVVTKRPSRLGAVVVGIGVLVIGSYLFVSPIVGASASDWESGEPVVVEVVGPAVDGEVTLRAPARSSTWTLDADLVERAGSTVPGTQFVSRLVGDCRCQLMLTRPQGLPWMVPVLGMFWVAIGVSSLLARRRWRRLPAVLRSPGRQVELEPVWLRRPVGAARWGVGARLEDRTTVFLELDRTSPEWFPDDGRAALHGPLGSGSLVALATPRGVAVSSSAPMPARRAQARVTRWSARLSTTIGLYAPTGDQVGPAEVGGDQRIHIRPRPEPVPLARVSGAALRMWTIGTSLVFLAIVAATRPTLTVVIGAWVALLVAGRALVWASIGRAASRPPFAGWSDRTAAREALAALAHLGLAVAPAHLVSRSGPAAWQAPPGGEPDDPRGGALPDRFDRPAP